MKLLKNLIWKLDRGLVLLCSVILLVSSMQMFAGSSQTSQQFCTRLKTDVVGQVAEIRQKLRGELKKQALRQINWKYKTYLEICPNLKTVASIFSSQKTDPNPKNAETKKSLRDEPKLDRRFYDHFQSDYQYAYVLAVPAAGIILWRLYF